MFDCAVRTHTYTRIQAHIEANAADRRRYPMFALHTHFYEHFIRLNFLARASLTRGTHFHKSMAIAAAAVVSSNTMKNETEKCASRVHVFDDRIERTPREKKLIRLTSTWTQKIC